MGMYDTLRCTYPLPNAAASEIEFQTKSLDCALDEYEIRADGTLWRQDYDIEDRSNPDLPGLLAIAGIATRVNQRWSPTDYTGEVRFWHWSEGKKDGQARSCTFSAYFFEGHLREIHEIAS